MRSYRSITQACLLGLLCVACSGSGNRPAAGTGPRPVMPTGFLQMQDPLLYWQGGGLVYDSARRRLVLLGLGCTYSIETREWSGSSWCRRAVDAADSGLDKTGFAMAYDPARRRVVVFSEAETWEWDGATWTLRETATRPPPRQYHAMAYAGRGRVVLFGGRSTAARSPTLRDTWEWDGTTWIEQMPAEQPDGRWGHAMAYDPARQRTVLFGGYSADTDYHDDTWEWDGTAWTRIDPQRKPPARQFHVMAYDGSAGRVVLAGGNASDPLNDMWDWDGQWWSPRSPVPDGQLHGLAFDESRNRLVLYGHVRTLTAQQNTTWEWDGQSWLAVDASESPGIGRNIVSMAHLSGRQRLVMFGGTNTPPTWYDNDTWEWDGASWTERQPAIAPSRRHAYAMASDERHETVVLFGGLVPTGRPSKSSEYHEPNGETWEWDGTRWGLRLPAHSPPPMAYHAMAYDAARERVVLFGDGSTWEWDGGDWTDRTTGLNRPSRRWSHALAYDAARERVVLFGGSAGNFTPLDDTWEWDGRVWQQVAVGPMPPRYQHTLTYDAARRRTVLLGGSNGANVLTDTWEWDGVHWSEMTTEQPPPRIAASAYFPPTRQIVLFNGATWIFTDPAHAERYGSGCPGTDGIPALAAFGTPSIGNTAFALDLIDARPRAAAAIWLALESAATTLPTGCELLVDTDTLIDTLSATASDDGFASVAFPIPPTAQAGIVLFLQAAVVDPAAPGGVALSQGLKLTVGR